uniref:Uncharacterized protein n=1 Tax=Anguilla anguilla TaxID=7936 RepID=A0A0E9TQ32_ANGAN
MKRMGMDFFFTS